MSRWLDRTLLLGPYIALATNEKEFKRLLRSMDLETDAPWLRDKWNASAHWWEQDSNMVCIVCIKMYRERDPIEVASLIAHEATHIWQVIERKIGGDIGDEMEAYAIQNLCQTLFTEYARRLNERPHP